jgi:hypothetical protein
MRTITHVAASAVLSAGTLAIAGPEAAAGVFIGGSVLDIDHLGLYLDAGLPRRPKVILSCMVRSECELQRAYSITRGVPRRWYFPGLHSVELMAVTVLVGFLLGSPALLGASVGMAVHVTMDLGNYPCSPRIWSTLWRYRNREKLREVWSTYVVRMKF